MRWMMRLKNRKPLSKEAKKDRMVYSLLILGTLTLLFGYSIVFCDVSTSLKFEGSGKIEGRGGPYYYNDGYFYNDETGAKNKSTSSRVVNNGSSVQTLSDMVSIMKTSSNELYQIYMMSPYNVASGGETVTVNKTVRIYLNKFNNSDAVFKVSNSLNINASSGKLYIYSNNSFTLTKNLFYNTSTLTLNNVQIDYFTASANVIDTSAGTLNLTNTEINSIESSTDLIYFSNKTSNFTFNGVNIHDNTFTSDTLYAVQGLYNCSTRKITGSSTIYNNKYSSWQSNLCIYDSNYTVDGSGLTSSCKIWVSVFNESPTTNAPVTLFTNIARKDVSPGVNITYDNTSYNTAYGDDSYVTATTIVLKTRGAYYYNNGYFYTSSSSTDSKYQVMRDGSAITTMSDMVDFMYNGEVLYMKSRYDAPNLDYTITVKNKQITIKRFVSNTAIFFVEEQRALVFKTEGNNLNGESSKLIIDGNKDKYSGASLFDVKGTLNLIGHTEYSIEVRNNTCAEGSAVYVCDKVSYASHPASVFFKYVEVDNNVSSNAVGAFRTQEGMVISLEHCYIHDNTAPYQGGGLWLNSSVKGKVDYCKFYQNKVTGSGSNRDGGGIFVGDNAKLNMTNSTVDKNSAGAWGGGIAGSGSSSVTIEDSKITNNTADQGGGISQKGDLTMKGTTISGNSGSGGNGGGLLFSWGYSHAGYITDCTFEKNTAKWGGGLHIDDNATLFFYGIVKIINNKTTAHSGGICCDGYLRCETGTTTFSDNEGGSAKAMYFKRDNGFYRREACTVNYSTSDTNRGCTVY